MDPISRAKFRLALNEIEHHWYTKYVDAYKDEVLDKKFVEDIKKLFSRNISLDKEKILYER